jgi:hypothetical protein
MMVGGAVGLLGLGVWLVTVILCTSSYGLIGLFLGAALGVLLASPLLKLAEFLGKPSYRP